MQWWYSAAAGMTDILSYKNLVTYMIYIFSNWWHLIWWLFQWVLDIDNVYLPTWLWLFAKCLCHIFHIAFIVHNACFQVILHSQVKASLTIYDAWLELQDGFVHTGQGNGRPTSSFFPLVISPTSKAGILFSICLGSTTGEGKDVYPINKYGPYLSIWWLIEKENCHYSNDFWFWAISVRWFTELYKFI